MKKFIPLFCLSFLMFFFSCTTSPKKEQIIPEITENLESEDFENATTEPDAEQEQKNALQKESFHLSRKILGSGQQTPQQLADFFLEQNPDPTKEYITYFANLYIEEASAENINWDVAFAQMCLETGFLRFGGLVQPEWHNYCGLGAMNAENPGCIFESEQIGIRAHIQHLQAYATTEDVVLKNDLVDPRYNWVHKTKFIEDIEGLTGTWATDPSYAQKLENILQRMENMINKD